MNGDTLVEKMRHHARTDERHGVELMQLAKDMEDATTGFFATPQTVDVKKFLSVYARVRKRWCLISGTPLVPPSVTRTSVAIAKLFRKTKP